jgi:hypothetical protein
MSIIDRKRHNFDGQADFALRPLEMELCAEQALPNAELA